ncbi:MAG: DUF4386 domain-containing protein [Cryobacterium sp.]|nr:DUF4386 domain-containing protein [Cryobacterium sp.]
MTQPTSPPAAAPALAAARTGRDFRLAGILAVIFGMLLFVPTIVLGAAIGWPASLGEPATNLMPLIAEQEGAVRLGYLSYLVYSVLFLPAVMAIARIVGDGSTTRLAIAFAAISTLARSIGIIRWLVVLPAIAAAWVAAPTDALAVVFTAINDWGGSIGELLGVSLFAAVAVGLLSVAILRSDLPRWWGWLGLVVSAGQVLPAVELFGVDLGALLTVTTTAFQIWFLAIGVALLMSSRSTSTRSASARGANN